MANVNNPFGLRPVRYLNGAPYNGANNYYHIPASNPAAMFNGDPVIMTGTANSAEYRGFAPGTLPDVALSAAPGAGILPTSYSNFILGSMVARLPLTRESLIYRPASIEAIVFVDEDPNVVYQIQDNGFQALGVNVVGQNANVIAGAGSVSTGQSGYMLDAGTVNAPSTSALQLTILRASDIINNDATAAFAVWDVVLNLHPWGASNIGV